MHWGLCMLLDEGRVEGMLVGCGIESALFRQPSVWRLPW